MVEKEGERRGFAGCKGLTGGGSGADSARWYYRLFASPPSLPTICRLSRGVPSRQPC